MSVGSHLKVLGDVDAQYEAMDKGAELSWENDDELM
jgi:hypothetical protein